MLLREAFYFLRVPPIAVLFVVHCKQQAIDTCMHNNTVVRTIVEAYERKDRWLQTAAETYPSVLRKNRPSPLRARGAKLTQTLYFARYLLSFKV